MRMEEEKVYEINDEDMHYDVEDDNFKRTILDNYGTGVEQLQTSMEENSYKGVRKQLQFLMNKDMCMKKQIK